MSALRVIGTLDPTFAWDGERLYDGRELGAAPELPAALRGAAATVGAGTGGSGWRIVRDPLGLNKLFFATTPDRAIELAARPRALVEHGHALEEIAAVPRGAVIELAAGEPEPSVRSLVPDRWSAPAPAPGVELERAGARIRDQLDGYLAAISARARGAPVYVCLSGGLDSSGIAVLVAEHFAGAVAVSFDLARANGRASEDRRMAARVAADLGLPMIEATVTADELLEPLDVVLREGIDWRDFNVHAGLVNAALARAIADDAERGEPPLVFTGDLANEFLVDYEPELYRGRTYYALPRLDPAALRSLLVRGLDTSHREVGIFTACGASLIQPYAVAVDAYMSLSEEFLRMPDRKARLCTAIFGERIPDYVLARPKARAQVGDADRGSGVLAACVERGLDDAALRGRFAELHGVADTRALDRFIRAGRYRARVPAPTEAGS